MSAALAIANFSETSRSERGYTPAANDNVPRGCNQHLSLVANNTEGTCNNLSRSPAFVRPDRARQTHALDMTYTYDPRGKITNVLNAAITGDNRTYNYDALGRLTTATGPWGANHTTGTASYVYDALGNMQSKTVGPRALAMAYDANNRLISHTDNIGPARNLSYDVRGNVTQLGGLFFTYDMSDQPTYISGTATGTYKYDGNLKRVKSTVDGKIIYNIFDAGGTLIHIDAVTDGKATDYCQRENGNGQEDQETRNCKSYGR